MIKSFTITNYQDDSLYIDIWHPEESGLAVMDVEGLGPVGADINVTDLSTSDGGLYNSARLNTRNIVMSFLFMRTSSESIEDIRQKTYKYFPEKRALTFIVETDNRTLQATGYVESNEPSIFSSAEGCTISIICPYPYFYAVGDDAVTITAFYEDVHLFEFDFSNDSLTDNELEFSSYTLLSENNIEYYGDAEIGITITLYATGEVVNPTIYNIDTRESMTIDTDKLETITGYGIVAGDVITICTVRGSKSITLLRDLETTNILNCLDKDTDWFEISKGDNSFAYTADEGADVLQVTITNQTIYAGV